MVAAAYTVLAIGSVLWGYSLTEPTESTVLMQLPVVPVLALLDACGMADGVARVRLAVFYGLGIPPVAAGLYAVCWLFGRLGVRTRLSVGVGLVIVLAALLFWPARQSIGQP